MMHTCKGVFHKVILHGSRKIVTTLNLANQRYGSNPDDLASGSRFEEQCLCCILDCGDRRGPRIKNLC